MKKKEDYINILAGPVPLTWGPVWEFDIQPAVGYWPEFFAPVSDIDETELVNHKEEVV